MQSTPAGYTCTQPSNMVGTIGSTDVLLTINCAETLYNLNVTATGLAAGTTVPVTYNGIISNVPTGSTILLGKLVNQPNTLAYTVTMGTSPAGYTCTTQANMLSGVINLSDVTITIDCKRLYSLNVTTSGLGIISSSSPTGLNCGRNTLNESRNPCSIQNLKSGDTVTLTATPQFGYATGTWSGCTTTSNSTCTVQITALSSSQINVSHSFTQLGGFIIREFQTMAASSSGNFVVQNGGRLLFSGQNVSGATVWVQDGGILYISGSNFGTDGTSSKIYLAPGGTLVLEGSNVFAAVYYDTNLSPRFVSVGSNSGT
ncbi:MAG: hypothetical protein EBU49_13215, partial [Proteobacteria bacterium]|nr:hypothetical protein [Pseudomonadota bacterium]